MFSTRVRLLLVVVAAVVGAYKLAVGDRSAYVLFGMAALFALGYLRYGAVRPAFMAMRRGDLDSARRHVDSVRYPSLLSRQSRAYWHWVVAALAAERADGLAEAEQHLRQAVGGALRTDHDRCLATAMLAEVVAHGGRRDEAVRLLDEAERIPHRGPAANYLASLRSEIGGSG